MSYQKDDRFTKKDWFVCEKCQHTNVINIMKAPRRQKRQRMIFTDDPTWGLFKSLAAEFGYDHGRMLAFLVGKLQHDRGEYDTATD